MNRNNRVFWARRLGISLLVSIGLSLIAAEAVAAAKPKLSLNKVSWSAKKHQLVIKGKLKNGPANTLIEAFGIDGQPLGTSTATPFSFTIPSSELPAVPCSVRVQAGSLDVTKAVAGNPNKACIQTPKCQITTPANGVAVKPGDPVPFTATATFPNKNAQPKYEWDFGGGAMGEDISGNSLVTTYKHADTTNPTVKFVRDHSRYRVHFSAVDGSVSAMESKQYRCEDVVEVIVGNPPSDLPDVAAMVNEASSNTPPLGSQLGGKKGDVVVLPFPGMTMQAQGDARYTQNLYVASSDGYFNTLNAQVYRKDRLPLQVFDEKEIALRYSATVNPADPVGPDSINSTSQNWPLNSDKTASAPFATATVQKTDQWERLVRPPTDVLASDYMSMSWMDGFKGGSVKPDEGFKISGYGLFEDKHGSYMPGVDAPFVKNEPQDFTTYNADERTHTAHNIPLTDIDDTGRVNPFPLLRVQAFDPATHQPIANAATDAVVATGKDFHCRQCHAKGKIAANPDLDWSKFQSAYHSSSEYAPCTFQKDCSVSFTPPTFFDSVDQNGQPSDSLADQEYAAVKNANGLHDFYDNVGMLSWMKYGYMEDGGSYGMDMPSTCVGCHASMLNPIALGWSLNSNPGQVQGDLSYYPTYSQSMHRFHAQLQVDPSDSKKILRETNGRPLRWDPSKGANPNGLFPTVNAQGESLPMEQSCLRCHSGHRDQLYRDRMFTAGTTCYDCHGDMLAVGKAYDKPKPGPEGNSTRVEWMDQPDCGSCHTGNANEGKGGANGFFSAGVLRRAFAESDRSATPRVPKNQRFAVQAKATTVINSDNWVDPQYDTRHSILSLSAPLYRQSRDTHGDVACGACHGGAHEVWPNRDPGANDNVTALQLQGHAGQILECNVCHTADSFKNEKDLDGGRFMTDLQIDSGVLGGPHNTHPINDPYWWKSVDGDVANSDGTQYGGWHNNYAKKPGKDGEDQCAACHGNDHLGTRLSRTPVDRVFDFSRFNTAKLKKAGFKKKVIKVSAGSFIGCNTCHSVATSCKNSPAGDQCGVASETVVVKTNHDPVIHSTAATTAVMGVPYRYEINATDEDGDPLTYSLGLKPLSMKLDDNGGIAKNWPDSPMSIDDKGVVTTDWPDSTFIEYRKGPFTFPYVVTVSDGKGGYATQTITVTLTCPGDRPTWEWSGTKQWDGSGSCVAKSPVTITSTPDVLGIDVNGDYSYQVTATDAGNAPPLTYSLDYHPDGMSINATTGLVTWKAKNVNYGQPFFKVKVSNNTGAYETQISTVVVCVPSKKWDQGMNMCR